MAWTGTINFKYLVDGSTSERTIDGRILTENISYNTADGKYQTIVETDGTVTLIGTTSPIASDVDHVFIEMISGSLDYRTDPAENWIPIPDGLWLGTSSLTRFDIRATPASGDGTATFNAIFSKKTSA